jgi:hypothetical protein
VESTLNPLARCIRGVGPVVDHRPQARMPGQQDEGELAGSSTAGLAGPQLWQGLECAHGESGKGDLSEPGCPDELAWDIRR